VGAQSALGRELPTPELLHVTFGFLADRVAGRLRAAGKAGRTITVRVRFADLQSVTRSATLPAAICTTCTLTEAGVRLAQSALADHPRRREISLLAISVSNLADESALQLELPLGLDGDWPRPGTASGSARWAADKAMDRARERFGRRAVGYAAVLLSDRGGVPDDFRELAERDPAGRPAQSFKE
jgi:DNA polymerase-4